MKQIQNLQKLIGDDLTDKMKAQEISQYQIHITQAICTQGTLTRILRGQSGGSVNLKILFDIYSFLGYDKIKLKDKENGIDIEIPLVSRIEV